MPTPDFILNLRQHVGHALLHLPTVGVLVDDGAGRLLLVQDAADGRWTCPGGIVEPFELPADAAVRETWEEAGVLVQLTGVVGVFGGPASRTVYANGDQIGWVATVFSARVLHGEPRPDGDETHAVRYVPREQIAALPLKPGFAMFLASAAPGQACAFQPPTWSPDAP